MLTWDWQNFKRVYSAYCIGLGVRDVERVGETERGKRLKCRSWRKVGRRTVEWKRNRVWKGDRAS